MKNKPVQEDMDELLNELCESYIAKGKGKKFSTREIEDLMGMHRPCYERRRGALRQK